LRHCDDHSSESAGIELPETVLSSPRRNPFASRFSLLLTLLAFLAVFALLGWATAHRAIQIAMARNLSGDITDLYAFGFTYVLIFYLLTVLPLLMVIGYRGIQGEMLTARVAEELALCGLREHQLRARLAEYQQSNSFSAFFLPLLVNLLILMVLWAATLLPHGIDGMLDYLSDGGTLSVSIAFMFPRIAADASLVIWALLGAYFYSLTVLIRRWMQSDLTTGVVWKIDVRLVITLVLGLLLVRLATGPERDLAMVGPYVTVLAFSIGIVPDVFLRWSMRQIKRVVRLDADDELRLFAPSDLQRRIPGISFWQMDRLAEEGVESVQDMAMKAIPTLLIRTRFDTPLLLSWVDRALLANHVGEQLHLFHRAHIHRATELIARTGTEADRAAVLRSLADAVPRADGELAETGIAGRMSGKDGTRGAPPPTEEQLANIISGLRNGPNLRELMAYWANTGAREGDGGGETRAGGVRKRSLSAAG
jgi:hypothetical protein